MAHPDRSKEAASKFLHFDTASRFFNGAWMVWLCGTRSTSGGGGLVGVGFEVDSLLGGFFLAAPLEVVGDGDVGHSHVDAHVLLVAVPAAEGFAALIVFSKGHHDAEGELPGFPVVAEIDDVEAFAPGDFFAPEVALGAGILACEDEAPMGQLKGSVSAPGIVV